MSSSDSLDTDECDVCPPSAVLQELTAQTSNDKPFQKSNTKYAQLRQSVSDYEQLSKPVDTSPEFNTTEQYVCATVISPPLYRQITTLDFSSSASSSPPSSSSSSSPSSSPILYSTQPISCSGYPTNFIQNHLYHHAIEASNQKYSTQTYLDYPGIHEHFFNTSSGPTTTCLNLHSEHISELLGLPSLPFETDLNNNHQHITDLNESRHLTRFNRSFKTDNIKTSLSDNPGKVIRLPPFSALLSGHSDKPGVLESSQSIMRKQEHFFDESDDTDVNIGSTFNGVGEETHYINLTNVGQSHLDEEQGYMDDTPDLNYLEWSCNPEYILKTEPTGVYESEDFYLDQGTSFSDPCDELNLDSPTTDSDGYSSSVERDSTFQYFSMTNAADVALYDSGSKATSYSGHDSSSSDEGYGEGTIPEYTLPDFSKLQNNRVDPEKKTTQHKCNSASLSKERKKSVRESLHFVEKVRQKPGRKPGQVSNVLHLWEFMRDLLHSPENQGIIEWISKADGVFKVINSNEVARLWGEKKKNKKEMTYEKLSRSLRYSRLEGYFAILPRDKNYPKKLCFKFGPKSSNWR